MNAAEARAAAGAESAKSSAQKIHGLELERNELVRRLSSTATAAQYPDVEATLKHCEGFVAQLRSLQVAIKQSQEEQAVLVKLCVEKVVLRAEVAAAEARVQQHCVHPSLLLLCTSLCCCILFARSCVSSSFHVACGCLLRVVVFLLCMSLVFLEREGAGGNGFPCAPRTNGPLTSSLREKI